MAPKRKAVLKTTRKVVKKTVEVSVVREEGNNRIETLESPVSMIVEEVSVEKSGVESVTVVKSPFREENTGKEKADQNDNVVDDTVDVEVERSKVGAKAREIPIHVGIMNANEEGNMDEDGSKRENRVTRNRVFGDEIRDIETQTPEEWEGEEGVEASPEETKKQKRKAVDVSMEEAEDSREPETPKKFDVKPNNMATPEKRKRKRRKRNSIPGRGDVGMGGIGGYKTYVYRVLKQVHPTLGMSSRAMDVLDMMMADMFERLAGEAAKLSKYTGKQTITSREVHGAVRLVLPGELSKHAISEGAKALSNYMKDI